MLKNLHRVFITLFLSIGLFATAGFASSDTDVTASFTDPAFLAFVLETCDKNGDGRITAEEDAKVTSLLIEDDNIESLAGLEHFVSLEELECSYLGLTELDLSGCTALKTLYCSRNNLTELNLSGLSELLDLEVSDNQLRTIDLSQTPKLVLLDCSDNQLSHLDVSHLKNLHSLYCTDNQLQSLDVSKNTALDTLVSDGNPLGSLDVSKNALLSNLSCDDNQLKTLNVSHNLSLERLYCSENQIETLDISINANLLSLDCSRNSIATLDLSKNTMLNHLICAGNQLTALDVSMLSELIVLECSGNQITSIALEKNRNLQRLDCSNNPLTGLDLSKNSALKSLTCSNIGLTSLEVSHIKGLWELYCQNNQLKELNLLENTVLYSLHCGGNQLTALSLPASMQTLDCSGNLLTELDLSATYHLYANISNNLIKHPSLVQSGEEQSVKYFPQAVAQEGWSLTFQDVHTSDWFYDAVQYGVLQGLFIGESEAAFSPNAPMSSLAAITVLHRAAGEPLPEGYPPSRFMVSNSSWLTISWAKEQGIMTDDSTRNINAYDVVTREDFAVLLLGYINAMNLDYAVNDHYIIFADDDAITEGAREAVQVLHKLDILNGVNENRIDPQGHLTRAQAAAMIQRLLDR